jgi:hypothetical protein
MFRDMQPNHWVCACGKCNAYTTYELLTHNILLLRWDAIHFIFMIILNHSLYQIRTYMYCRNCLIYIIIKLHRRRDSLVLIIFLTRSYVTPYFCFVLTLDTNSHETSNTINHLLIDDCWMNYKYTFSYQLFTHMLCSLLSGVCDF